MDRDDNQIKQLLWRYLEGKLDTNEENRVRHLLTKYPHYVRTLFEFADYRLLLKETLQEETFEEKIIFKENKDSFDHPQLPNLDTTEPLQKSPSLGFNYSVLGMAACFALIVGLCTLFYVIIQRDSHQQLVLAKNEAATYSLTNTSPSQLLEKNQDQQTILQEKKDEVVLQRQEDVNPSSLENISEGITEPTEAKTEVTSKENQIIAKLLGISGKVFILTQSSLNKEPVKEGQNFHVGEGLQTEGKGSRVTLQFPDKTVVELQEESKIARLVEEAPWKSNSNDEEGDRYIYLSKGQLIAHVSKRKMTSQNADDTESYIWRHVFIITPHAEVQVIGTKFLVNASSDSTELDVAEGRVKLTNVFDKNSIEVVGGQYSIAAQGIELIQKSFIVIDGLKSWVGEDMGINVSNQEGTHQTDAILNQLGRLPNTLFDRANHLFENVLDGNSINIFVVSRNSQKEYVQNIYILESPLHKKSDELVNHLLEVGKTSIPNGEIIEVITYNRMLSAEEREKVEWYLKCKYNISSRSHVIK